MSTSTRVVAFVVGLVVVFVGALGIGRAFGPADPEPPADPMTHAAEDHATDAPAEGVTGHDLTTMGGGDGLASSAGGYTLAPAVGSLEPGLRTIEFTITGPDDAPVTSYDTLHERPLHLIAVRRDLTGYQHLHPTLDASGSWSVSVRLQPGFWRLIADFVPSGAAQTTLGTDLVVGRAITMTPLGPDTTTDRVDGYAVSLAGTLHTGLESTLTLSVTRVGRPVTDLERYLDAYGHLVMLRAGDIAYVHVHAVEGSSGPELAFEASAPEPGRYRLFLDFQHAGVVRTAEFTVTVS